MKTSNNNRDKGNKVVMVMFFSTYKTPSFLKEYKHKSEILSRAIKESRSVEILTNNEAVLRIKNLGIEAGKFFGLKTIKGSLEQIWLNINDIKKITML
jgi:hypothetical protein